MLISLIELWLISFNILVNAHATGLGYSAYGTAENDANSNRKLHHIKSHQQVSSSGQIDNNRPIEEMPYQVIINYYFK